MRIYVGSADGTPCEVEEIYVGNPDGTPVRITQFFYNYLDTAQDPANLDKWPETTPTSGIDVTDYTYTMDSPETGIVTLETYTGSATDIITPHGDN